MTTHESERISFWARRWEQHLDQCQVCNYNEECRMCLGAYPDAVESDIMHNCNCVHGLLDNGAHIRLQHERERREGEPATPIPIITDFQYSLKHTTEESRDGTGLSSAVVGSLIEVEATLSNGKVYRGVFRR